MEYLKAKIIFALGRKYQRLSSDSAAVAAVSTPTPAAAAADAVADDADALGAVPTSLLSDHTVTALSVSVAASAHAPLSPPAPMLDLTAQAEMRTLLGV